MADLPAKPSDASGRRLDRAALDRVLARAAELQGADGDPSDALSEAQLMEVAREVGISPEALRVALAEERTRVALPVEQGLAARIAGPGMIGAARTVDGTPAQVLEALDRWMRDEECLQPMRRQADRMSWEPRRDMMGRMKVGLNLGGRGYSLSRAGEVAATVAAVDARRVHVQLVADVADARRSRLIGGGAMAGAGALGGSGLMTIPFVAPDALLAPIAAGAALLAGAGLFAGRLIARTHLATARRVQVGLERILDRLEQGDAGRAATIDPKQLLQGFIQDALKPRHRP